MREEGRWRDFGELSITARGSSHARKKLTVDERDGGGASFNKLIHADVLLSPPPPMLELADAAADVPARMYAVPSSGAEKRDVSSGAIRNVASSPTSIVARATWTPFHSGGGISLPPSATVDPVRK